MSAAAIRQRASRHLQLRRIRRDRNFFNMMASGAVEGAKFDSCGPRRDARKRHARSAFRAAKQLDGEQRDSGQVIGHCIPPPSPSQAAAEQNTKSPEAAEVVRRPDKHAPAIPESLINIGRFTN